mmetsp:Transcript_6217/g.14135  ORF Transcript_6217/g.14135 Transcript_6217/m.14135 type:complete len:541 (+) Transcript_6217:79-1701(+)
MGIPCSCLVRTEPRAPRKGQKSAATTACSPPKPAQLRSEQTRPPVRLRMVSADILCVRSMEVEWDNARGERQSWSSWADELCGWFEAEKCLPSSSTRISVRFKVRTPCGAVDVCATHRESRDWVRDASSGHYAPEVIAFREDTSAASPAAPVDVVFELAGPVHSCRLLRAWNSARAEAIGCRCAGREAAPPEWWERWEEAATRPHVAPRLPALEAADEAAPPSKPWSASEGPRARYTRATLRLTAANRALQCMRREAIKGLSALDQEWCDAGETTALGGGTGLLSAGLGLVAVVGLAFAPQLGLTVGIGSAALGAATAGESLSGHSRLRELRGRLSEEARNALVVAELEREWLEAKDSMVGKPAAAAAARAAAAAAAAAAWPQKPRSTCADAQANEALGVAPAWKGRATPAAAAAKALGAAGAALSSSLVARRWSTAGAMRAVVQRKLRELPVAIFNTQRWLVGVGELECPICLESIALTDDVRRCTASWHYTHEACQRRWETECWSKNREPRCSLCDATVSLCNQALQDFLASDVRSRL